jgi:Holliday junction resolvase RusA-like endonuclease
MIHFCIPGLPPSANHAYFNLPHGGRSLTKEGEKYKNETKALLAQKYSKDLKYFVQNEPYLVFIRFKFSSLQNATWGKKNGANTRYKRTDVSNRVKLLEDVLKDVTAVDDSHTMTLVTQKVEGSPECTDVFIWNSNQEESPFDELLFRL